MLTVGVLGESAIGRKVAIGDGWMYLFLIVCPPIIETVASLLCQIFLDFDGRIFQVHDIVRTVDLDCDGYVSWGEFKRAFHEPCKSLIKPPSVNIDSAMICDSCEGETSAAFSPLGGCCCRKVEGVEMDDVS